MAVKTTSKARLKHLLRTKIKLPILLLCILSSFLAGFYASPFSLLFANLKENDLHHKPRILDENNAERHLTTMPRGHTGESDLNLIPFQILSWKPRAVYFPSFASEEQCRRIINMAKSRLRPSKLALRKGETADSTQNVRTSSGTFIRASEDSSGVLADIERKIARAAMLPRENGEPFNVLRYEIGQHYASHYDSFNPAEYGPQISQRVASFLLYLSDVEEGGETMFPYENGFNMDSGYDYNKCIGLKVKPRRGDGLLFYSLLANGTIDKTSLHGSCPVIRGEKWVATKWIRDNSFTRRSAKSF